MVLGRFGKSSVAPAEAPEGPPSGPVWVEPEEIGIAPDGVICPAKSSRARWVVRHQAGMWAIIKDGEYQGSCRRQMDALRLVQQAIAPLVPRPFITRVYGGGDA